MPPLKKEMCLMPELIKKPKIIKPMVEEVYEKYIQNDALRKSAERLFEIAREHKMRNRWMSYNSFTFTFRGVNIFNITMRATMKNKGVRKIDPTNHFIVQLSLGKKHEVEKLLLSQSEEMKNEYVVNKYISCMMCRGSSGCDNCLDFELMEAAHPLCTCNFGYACHNPTPKQFEMIEQFIMARIGVIDMVKK